MNQLSALKCILALKLNPELIVPPATKALVSNCRYLHDCSPFNLMFLESEIKYSSV